MAGLSEAALLVYFRDSALACPFHMLLQLDSLTLRRLQPVLVYLVPNTTRILIETTPPHLLGLSVHNRKDHVVYYLTRSFFKDIFKCRVSLYSCMYLIIFSTWNLIYQVWKEYSRSKAVSISLLQ